MSTSSTGHIGIAVHNPHHAPNMDKLKPWFAKKRHSHREHRNVSSSPISPPSPNYLRPLEIGNTNPFRASSMATTTGSRRTRPSEMAEPPPPYSAGPPLVELPGSFPRTSASSDDQYAFLSTFDTVFLIDDSGSMAGSNWTQTARALEAITPVCTQHDKDGVDILFLNHPHSFKNVTAPSTVREIFSTVRPGGGTPTGQRLQQILKPYMRQLEALGEDGELKPLNIIVITDGVASDDVESVLLNAAKKLDRLDAPAWQVGVQFFQVGREEGAREMLQDLDDELGGARGRGVRDIVDTVPWNGQDGDGLSADGILKCVLGSVVKRLDRRDA